MLTTADLKAKGDELSLILLKSTERPSKILGYEIVLLEICKYQINRWKKLGYCDYELAYICHHIAIKLLAECEKNSPPGIHDMVEVTRGTLLNMTENIKSILQNLSSLLASALVDPLIDPLLSRFNNLTKPGSSNSSTLAPINGMARETEEIDSHRFTELISSPQLHQLLSQKKSVLLIDYRSRKEHDYNHINYEHIVNVEPSIVDAIYCDNVTDENLEEKLRMLLSDKQYNMFRNRSKYDLVVIYNLKYGVKKHRFDGLVDSLINGDNNGVISKNPFIRLIDILTYKSKYISSKLKRAPCFLSGGVAEWYNLYGDKSIARTIQMVSPPEPSLSRNSSPSLSRVSSHNSSESMSFNSPYLKSFSDYLGTAKKNGFTTANRAPRIGEYTPSTPLKPKINYSDTQVYFDKPNTAVAIKPSKTESQVQPPSYTNGSILSDNELNSQPKATPNFLEQYATGLTNLGNSCYMNCILQCLGGTPQLTKFFFPTFPVKSSPTSAVQSYRQHINVNNKLGTKGILTTNFVSLLMNMFGNTGGNFSPLNFKKVMGSLSPGGQFANFDQQDCIEFLTFLLDSLHEDLNQMVISDPKEKQAIMELTPEQEKTREYLPVRLASTIEWERYLKLNFSVIVDYFQGQYLSQLRCLECGTTSTTYNAFLILSLPIPEKLGGNKQLSVEDCLQEFVQVELLDDENKWHCSNCKRFTRLTKKITITRLPQILIIHFKRFKLSPTGYFSKIDDFIKFPVNEVLDLTSYWPEAGTSVNPNVSPVMAKDKELQVLSSLPTRNQIPPFRYKLYAVANHFGNLTTGHYTSYVYKQSDSKKTREWCYFDDSKVSYNQKPNQVVNKNAYCLFYHRI